MNLDRPTTAAPEEDSRERVSAASADVVTEMAGLVSRLLKDPESDSAVIPQMMRLSESVPPGAARGAVESSVAAMSQLRGWLQQLQARQRMHTRFTDISGRLSRVEGVQPLMVALADEARRLVDAPLARLDAYAGFVGAGTLAAGAGTLAAGAGTAGPGLTACSGEFISRLGRLELEAQRGGFQMLGAHGSAAVLQLADAPAEMRPDAQSSELAEQLRAEGVHGLIVVPMTQEGRPFGTLMVADRMMRRWTQLDVEALQHLATVSTRAIARAARAEAAEQSLQTLAERPALQRWGEPTPGLPRGATGEPGATGEAGPSTVETVLKGLLRGAPAAALQAFVNDAIGPLRRADAARGTALCTTLLTYIEHGHNARAAAKVMGVHVNTLHNRLESIHSLLPGWSEPARALDLHLALRLAASPKT